MFTKIILFFIRCYQRTLSPDHGMFASVVPYACAFSPTCSQYMYEAIERFGLTRGFFYGVRRILRCHPFAHGGYDPLPQKTISSLIHK